ncbi:MULTISPECIES: hypothetical protein [unclassified Streptomyces]|uniref:hypothetical protein n=1 Tax=unclassified Streptomyces TaxID=2593676 RepID=UPI0040434FD5
MDLQVLARRCGGVVHLDAGEVGQACDGQLGAQAAAPAPARETRGSKSFFADPTGALRQTDQASGWSTCQREGTHRPGSTALKRLGDQSLRRGEVLTTVQPQQQRRADD